MSKKSKRLTSVCCIAAIGIGICACQAVPSESELNYDELSTDRLSAVTETAETAAADSFGETTSISEAETETETEIVEEVTVAAMETAASTPIAPAVTTLAETIPVILPDSETTDTAAVTESDESAAEASEIDYSALAEQAFFDVTASAKRYVDNTKKRGSVITYPFEARNNYDSLTDSQKEMYTRLKSHIESFDAMYIGIDELSSDMVGDLHIAAEAMYADAPLLQCYSELSVIDDGENNISAELRFFNPKDGSPSIGEHTELIYEMNYFEAVCDYIVSTIPEDYSTYDKYRYLASVISLTAKYDHDNEAFHNNDSAYASIIGGLCICEGYAIGFEYLCERADLWCGRVKGSNTAYDVHMWNLVKLESGTYHVDVTWSDNGSYKPCTLGWQRYFMKTQDEVLENHIISDGTVATGTKIEN